MNLDDRDLKGYDMTGTVSTGRQAIETPDIESWKTELVSDEEAAERYAKIREQNDRVAREELAKGFAARVNEMY
jgi:hypothetical protein